MSATARAAARHRERNRAHDEYIDALDRLDRAERAFTAAFEERRAARKVARKAGRNV